MEGVGGLVYQHRQGEVERQTWVEEVRALVRAWAAYLAYPIVSVLVEVEDRPFSEPEVREDRQSYVHQAAVEAGAEEHDHLGPHSRS